MDITVLIAHTVVSLALITIACYSIKHFIIPALYLHNSAAQRRSAYQCIFIYTSLFGT